LVEVLSADHRSPGSPSLECPSCKAEAEHKMSVQ
jgi:hypothetical protein